MARSSLATWLAARRFLALSGWRLGSLLRETLWNDYLRMLSLTHACAGGCIWLLHVHQTRAALLLAATSGWIAWRCVASERRPARFLVHYITTILLVLGVLLAIWQSSPTDVRLPFAPPIYVGMLFFVMLRDASWLSPRTK